MSLIILCSSLSSDIKFYSNHTLLYLLKLLLLYILFQSAIDVLDMEMEVVLEDVGCLDMEVDLPLEQRMITEVGVTRGRGQVRGVNWFVSTAAGMP